MKKKKKTLIGIRVSDELLQEIDAFTRKAEASAIVPAAVGRSTAVKHLIWAGLKHENRKHTKKKK